MFTQPLMYKKIRQHKNAHQQYVERLLTEGDISKQQVRGLVSVLVRVRRSGERVGRW
jgi:2-oxoglutarate dehydrogenase complex dehydrogenase (E1) component-like enzyme